VFVIERPIRYTKLNEAVKKKTICEIQAFSSLLTVFLASDKNFRVTYNYGNDNPNQPQLKYNEKILLDVSNHPADCTKSQDDPVEQ
jgi:hypothetical protein